MRILTGSTRHLLIAVSKAAAVALVAPLVVLAGLLALLAVPALVVRRQAGGAHAPSHRRGRAPVLRLESSLASSGSAGRLGGREA